MNIKTHTTRRYFITAEEVAMLERASNLIDELYRVVAEGGVLEEDAASARNGIDYLLEELHYIDGAPYWEEDTTIEEEP